MRGGVSVLKKEELNPKEFSPHAWMCFFHYYYVGEYGGVFSTCVEVFLCPFQSFTKIRGS